MLFWSSNLGCVACTLYSLRHRFSLNLNRIQSGFWLKKSPSCRPSQTESDTPFQRKWLQGNTKRGHGLLVQSKDSHPISMHPEYSSCYSSPPLSCILTSCSAHSRHPVLHFTSHPMYCLCVCVCVCACVHRCMFVKYAWGLHGWKGCVCGCLSCVLVSSDSLTVQLKRLKHSERGILCEHSTSLTCVSSPDFPGRYSLWNEFPREPQEPAICLTVYSHALFMLCISACVHTN